MYHSLESTDYEPVVIILWDLQIPRGRLACHDTEDEDKSSSITDHLLHEKSILRSPDTAQHTNEISNTEDEVFLQLMIFVCTSKAN